MKIVLAYPSNNLPMISVMPPLGALYLTSFLKSKGIGAKIYDFNLYKNEKKVFYEIIDEEPDIIGLTSDISNFSSTNRFAKLVKRVNSDIKVIVGGPYPSCLPELYLENKAIDAVCVGEGEHTLYEYVKEGNNAPGLMIKKKGTCFSTGKREFITDLDSLPFPAYEELPIKQYNYLFQKGKQISSMITSRGCPYNCIYCFHGVHGSTWRPRSPKNIIEEIKWQNNNFGIDDICLWDDNFTFDLKRTVKICNLIKKEGIKIYLQTSNGLRVDRINKKTLILMKEAGFWSVPIAPETGDPYILKKLRKGFNFKQIFEVSKWCKELDLFTPMYILIGLPFEDISHVMNTYNFVKKIKPDAIILNRFTPYPNTPISKKYSLEKDISDTGYHTIKLEGKNFEKYFYKIYLRAYMNLHVVKKFYTTFGLKNLFSKGMRFIKSYIMKK